MFITNKTFWTKTEVMTLKHRLYIEDVQRPIVTPQVHVFKTLFWYFDSRCDERGGSNSETETTAGS